MPLTPVAIQSAEPARAPIRDDWAYEAAAKIYALALAGGPPMACVDLIAHDLRIAYCRGATEALKEALADMERRP